MLNIKSLNNLYEQYNRPEFLQSDPVEFPHLVKDESAREVIALLAALFAYGNVRAIRSFLGDLFDRRPEMFREELVSGKAISRIQSINLYYRFQRKADILVVLEALSEIFREKNGNGRTLDQMIAQHLHTDADRLSRSENRLYESGEKLRTAIDHIQSSILNNIPANKRTRGVYHLVGMGNEGSSARKRYSMFFRWMVRDEFPDFGHYKSINKSDLVIPLDIHMQRMGEKLGIRTRKTPDWKCAVQITDAFREICPHDPLRYDFALTRPGILKVEKKV